MAPEHAVRRPRSRGVVEILGCPQRLGRYLTEDRVEATRQPAPSTEQ